MNSMTHYDGKLVALEEVCFSHNCNMTISKTENDGVYQLVVGFYTQDGGHSTSSTIHFPRKAEILEVAKAFEKIAKHFPSL